jgi:mannose-6-phosphate isomerase-like protein (cupin superfamily)
MINRYFQNGEKVEGADRNTITLLIERNETNMLELALIRWPEGSKGAMAAHKDKEQTFFVRSGRGQVTIDGHTEEILPFSILRMKALILCTKGSFRDEWIAGRKEMTR